MSSALRNLVDRIELLFDRIGKFAILLIMVLTAADAGGRYLFDYSLPGAVDLIENFFMIAAVFLTLARTQALGGNISIDMLRDRFPEALRRLLDVVYLSCAFAAYLAITWVAFRFGAQAMAANRWTTGLTPMPVGPSWIVLGCGTTLLCLRLAIQVTDLLRGTGQSAATGHLAGEMQ